VFFDNLIINQKREPMLEQKDYYPFGLEIPGLSTYAFKPGIIRIGISTLARNMILLLHLMNMITAQEGMIQLLGDGE
jgi:hypothetical protein